MHVWSFSPSILSFLFSFHLLLTVWCIGIVLGIILVLKSDEFVWWVGLALLPKSWTKDWYTETQKKWTKKTEMVGLDSSNMHMMSIIRYQNCSPSIGTLGLSDLQYFCDLVYSLLWFLWRKCCCGNFFVPHKCLNITPQTSAEYLLNLFPFLGLLICAEDDSSVFSIIF